MVTFGGNIYPRSEHFSQNETPEKLVESCSWTPVPWLIVAGLGEGGPNAGVVAAVVGELVLRELAGMACAVARSQAGLLPEDGSRPVVVVPGHGAGSLRYLKPLGQHPGHVLRSTAGKLPSKAIPGGRPDEAEAAYLPVPIP